MAAGSSPAAGSVIGSSSKARLSIDWASWPQPGNRHATSSVWGKAGDVVGAYAERCRALGIAVKKQVVSADAAEARLVCEGDLAVVSADDVWVIAERAAGALSTEVRITAGPGLTATYNF